MGWGIVISSFIFTAAHYPTWNAMPVNFISGVILAWVYDRSGSVIPAMMIHSAFNIIAVLLTAMG
ncbi:CPBP family intramembrane glutamic endopeptidase [Paenibacillus aquistagni]|uniref:CPBP family intramembrane glutamic endopeptidase n=1 Tax=Paenibacillus aquistagni TaxID=1852522 RepID=UPI001F11340D|nr:CPBP family intramembrane glutamic endopeptidase [Paenibacillus aquistagni]